MGVFGQADRPGLSSLMGIVGNGGADGAVIVVSFAGALDASRAY